MDNPNPDDDPAVNVGHPLSDSESICSDSSGSIAILEINGIKFLLPKGSRLTVERFEKISKRLSYVLRYGARQEELETTEDGYVKFDDLMSIRLMQHSKRDEVLTVLENSSSKTTSKRFEMTYRDDILLVRATYGRKFERPVHHEDSKVHRLLEICLNQISDNISTYDFEGFPDEWLITLILRRLKVRRKLTRAAFESLFSSSISKLDLDGVYITEAGLRILMLKCSRLLWLSFRNSGYIMNDHYVNQLIRKLPSLKHIDLSYCHDLTDLSVTTLLAHGSHLETVKLAGCCRISVGALQRLATELGSLRCLDITDRPIPKSSLDLFHCLMRERPFKVIYNQVE